MGSAAQSSAASMLKEAVLQLTLAVGRRGKLMEPPANRYAFSPAKDSPRMQLVGEVMDRVMLTSQEVFEALLKELDSKRQPPQANGEGSFGFDESNVGRPWFRIQVEIYEDLIILRVSEIYQIKSSAA